MRIRGRRLQRRREMFRSREPFCAVCLKKGIVRVWAQLDHIIALRNGGPDTDDNLQGLCDECHEAKTRRDMGQEDKVSAACDEDGLPRDPDHHWNTDE